MVRFVTAPSRSRKPLSHTYAIGSGAVTNRTYQAWVNDAVTNRTYRQENRTNPVNLVLYLHVNNYTEFTFVSKLWQISYYKT